MPTFGRPRIATRIASSADLGRAAWPGKQLEDRVEEVAGAVAVQGRERDRVAEPEPVELECIWSVRAGSSTLFASRSTGLRERRSRIAAISSSPGVIPACGVDDEEDEVGLVDAVPRLLGDLARDRRAVGDVDAAGVDEQEALPAPLADELLAVARDARRLVDDGLRAIRSGG